MDLQLHQHKQQKLFICILSCLASILFLITSSMQVRADDYLDALRNEASDLEYLDETRPGNTISTKTKTVSPEINKASLSINNFENYYRTRDSAGAAIYFKLTTEQRLSIYHRFKATMDFEVARKITIEMFNKK